MVKHYQIIHICTHNTMQGGGGEDVQKRKHIVHEFISKQLIRSSEKLNVTNHDSISVIPSQQEVRDAITHIVQEQEKAPNEYVYIEFPFGRLDYTGLKEIEQYYMDVELKRCTSEEKHWLYSFESQSVQKIGISLDKVIDYFKAHVWGALNDRGKAIRKLVGKTWVTDNEIDYVFNMLNAQRNTDIFLSYKTPTFLYANIKEKLQNVQGSVERLFVVLNVGHNRDGTSYISSPERQGNHWSLLVINVKKGSSLYCDSKGWTVPINIGDTVGCLLAIIETEMAYQ